ncbi:hypothetical protein ACLG6S_17550 [Thermodesulfobacteriota bacterium B35]
MLDSISYDQQAYTSLTVYQSSSLEATISRKEDDGDGQPGAADRVTLRQETTFALTYSRALLVEVDEEAAYRKLQDLVTSLLTEQGIATTVDTGDGEIDIASLTTDQAQELVAEDGYFGVEKTSQRIFDFAVATAGGDPSRIDAIREGISRGFEEAMKAFGGWLPQISHDTIDAVMEKLEHWVAESETAAGPVNSGGEHHDS